MNHHTVINALTQYYNNSIEILHTLSPIGVAMVGADEYDPYKD